MKRDLVSFALWSREEIMEILDLARGLVASPARPLQGKTAALVFERESLRTRVSFEVGIAELGDIRSSSSSRRSASPRASRSTMSPWLSPNTAR